MIVSGRSVDLSNHGSEQNQVLILGSTVVCPEKVSAVTVCWQPHCFNVTASLTYLGIFHPGKQMFHEKAQGFGLASFCHGKCGILLDLLPSAM